MGQRVIPVAVTAEYIGGDGVTLGAAGSHNSVVIEYDFRSAGPMWEPPEGGSLVKYVLWTNPQGNTTNRVDLGVDKIVDGFEGKVYHASPTADAMCVAGWAEMVVVGAVVDNSTTPPTEVMRVKTEPSRFRVLPGSSRAADNEGIAATVADQIEAEIAGVDDRKVNKPMTPLDPNGQRGQVLESLGDGATIWADPTVTTDEQVERVLAQHPTWTTTVQDGAVSERKLADAAVTNAKIADGSVSMDKLDETLLQDVANTWFSSRTEFFDYPMLSLEDSGVSSLQGICVIEDKYILTIRYSGAGNDNRLFEIWDPDTKTRVSSVTFTSAEVGHCNSAAYDRGFVYVTTFHTTQEIACLRYDSTARTLSFDRYINTNGVPLSALAVHNGVFYGFDQDTPGTIDGKLLVYRSTDLEIWRIAFRTDFDGKRDLVILQGFEFDGQYLYFPASGEARPEDSSLENIETLPRRTERIFVTDLSGNVQKQFAFKRGAYEEVEDVAVYQKNGHRYLLVGLNQDDYHICFVYVLPIYKSDENSAGYGSEGWHGTVYNSYNLMPIYVDTANGSPFGIGVSTDPFKSVPAALSFIKRHNIRANIYVSGTMFNCEIHNMPQMVNLYFNAGAKIEQSVIIRNCPFVAIWGDGATPCEIGGRFSAESSTVSVRGGIAMTNTYLDGQGDPEPYALEVLRSFFTGNLASIADYPIVVRAMTSVVNIGCDSISALSDVSSGEANIISINNEFVGRAT